MNDSSGPAVILQTLKAPDLDLVAGVHCRAFPGSALTRLGREAVWRYYLWQMGGPHRCHAMVAIRDGQLVGFCFSGVFSGALGGFLRANRNFLVGRLLCRPWLLVNDLVWNRARQAWRSLSGRPRHVHVSAPLEAAPRPGAFGILSIAVDPLCQGMGVAALLMADSEQTAREWGFSEMSLTVAMENQRAIRFYEKQGWRRVHLGEAWEGYMTKDLGTRLSGTGTNHA